MYELLFTQQCCEQQKGTKKIRKNNKPRQKRKTLLSDYISQFCFFFFSEGPDSDKLHDIYVSEKTFFRLTKSRFCLIMRCNKFFLRTIKVHVVRVSTISELDLSTITESLIAPKATDPTVQSISSFRQSAVSSVPCAARLK